MRDRSPVLELDSDREIEPINVERDVHVALLYRRDADRCRCTASLAFAGWWLLPLTEMDPPGQRCGND